VDRALVGREEYTVEGELSKNERKERRFYLTRPVGITLYFGQQNEAVTCSLVNVSRSGLCVGAKAPLPDDSRAFFRDSEHRVALRTIWSLAVPHENDRIRYGFACIDPTIDLIGTLRRAGVTLGETFDKFQSEDEAFVEQFKD
jgi:hypothetical protein